MSTINPTIVRGPYDFYVAPVGTAFTGVLSIGSLDVAWKKFAARGIRSQGDGGLTISHKQKLDEFRGQSNVIQDIARSEEDVIVSLEVADVSMEALSYALNSNLVTTTAPSSGIKGHKKMPVARGPEVAALALLIIIKSTQVVGEKGVLYIPKAVQTADNDNVGTKSSPAMTKYEFKAVEGPAATDTDPDIGYYDVISAPAI